MQIRAGKAARAAQPGLARKGAKSCISRRRRRLAHKWHPKWNANFIYIIRPP